MLARRQELNTQFQQLIDALVLAFSLLAAHALRFYSTSWFDLTYAIEPFQEYEWLLLVIMPFGPIILDFQGFYQSPLNKTIWRSFVQITRTMVYLGIIVSGRVIFLHLPLKSRAVPLLFIGIAMIALLIKERLLVRRMRRRAARGEWRERVLLAGVPEDMAALERSLTPDEILRLEVAARIAHDTSGVVRKTSIGRPPNASTSQDSPADNPGGALWVRGEVRDVGSLRTSPLSRSTLHHSLDIFCQNIELDVE